MDNSVDTAVDTFVGFFFRPPIMPPIELPLIARATGAGKAIESAFNLAYWTGAKDGLMWGWISAVVVVLIVSRILAAIERRRIG